MPFCSNCGTQVTEGFKFCGNCGKPVVETPRVCGSCNSPLSGNTKFCQNCGHPADSVADQPNHVQQSAPQPQPTINVVVSSDKGKEPAAQEEETEYWRGNGELVIKRTEHRGAARKAMGIAAGLATFGVGYVVIGKDKTRKSKAEGLIVITNKAIYVAGNDYPFDRIISLTKQGTISKSIVITFEKDVQAGGRGTQDLAATGGLSIEAEIKTKEIDSLFAGLERAKLSRIKHKAA